MAGAAADPLPDAPAGEELAVELADEDATSRLAGDIAAVLAPGNMVTLSGDLGSGKTTFARALIRRLAGDASLEVPSPTFTLMQTYDLQCSIVHVDLYRVNAPEELVEMGFADLADDAIVLVEWPDRADGFLLPDRLDLDFAMMPERGPTYRLARITAQGALATRIERLTVIRRFLEEAGFGTAERMPVQGDASTRAYERLALGERRAILMNAPHRPDGPPLRGGLPYSRLVHLAEDVKPFVAMARALRERGFSAPAVQAADLEAGLLILEDFGSEPVVAGDPPLAIEERYAAGVDLLVALHQLTLPEVLPVSPRIEYRLPRYDLDAFLIEAELLLDWYLPQHGAQPDAAAREEFAALWREALAAAVAAPATWVLRDYHSPNLLWLAQRQGIARVGLLDFQDALLGPPAYDVVSLLQDARVDVPESIEVGLLSRYIKARRAHDRTFDLNKFFQQYAVVGAQRATKILGIFSRLAKRDGKPQYLRHQPRIWRNLRRSLSHPELKPLKTWYDKHAPAP
ncbi:MAG: tRNA (adenosine(37)-N6)-threonylcarbamoyltransferase complex ATPase subunit type 1 TsaE [Xanthobacteraceae bacterium]